MVLKYIEVILSPNKEEAKADQRSLNVITRSQDKKTSTVLENKEVQTKLLIKKKRGQNPRSRRSKKAKSESQETPKIMEEENVGSQAQNNTLLGKTAGSSQSSRGSVIVDKVHE